MIFKKMKKVKISVVIPTKNEERMIKDCLASVKWADEIVVIDDYSQDKTREIAKKFGARVFLHRWQGFSQQKNYGFRKTKGEWVLFLDADERVTPELKTEILQIIKSPQVSFVGYKMPRLNNLLGQDMHFGGWYPDYQTRLVKREKFKGWRGKLHEQLLINGRVGRLKSHLYHLTHRSLSAMIEKTQRWSKIEAELLEKAGHPPVTWWRILRIMLTEFWQRGVKKQGWRDGTVGWIEIFFQMFSRFFTYARLWEKQNRKVK